MAMSLILEVLAHDAYNQALVSNVHPVHWENPEPAPHYNLVVIGAGTAGLVTAAGAAGLGAKVALVERHLLGGDCLNVGCVPSKCIIRSSRVVADIRDANQFGIRVPQGMEVDFPFVMERMRRLRARISVHDSARRFKEMGVDLFLGEGGFSGPDTMEVAGKALRFRKAVITTGTRPVHPTIQGLAEAGFLTNETVFSLTEHPRRLAVIGGGPIGCELAQAFRRLGSEVILFHNASHILNREDSDAAEILQQSFIRDGIRLVLDCRTKRVEKKNGSKIIHIECGGKEEEIAVDEILAAAGRAPNVEGLNLEAVGVKYDKREGVEVNEHLQTTNPRIYAAGDICLKYKFTHTADATARMVIQNALFLGRKKQSALTIPWCTYTDPEVAHVGMYEKDTRDKGIAVDTFIRPLNDVDRAIADGEEEGFVKIHVKKGTDRILGATIVARHAGEMLSEITLAIVSNVGLGTLSNVIHTYPTQAEAIKQAADAYNRTRLTPFIKGLFTRWLAWRR
ncbi:MAG TPA: mercuric reductase [Thermodesulfobacteriota bacterium]|nr:mercuric reductase [Thermodesulfobacteriota bacterium]